MNFLLNSWIGRTFNKILKYINRLIPKKDTQILFESIPDFSDNPMQLYNYIKSLNVNYRLLWVVDEIIDIDAPQYKRNTLRELWQFLRSKYIVTSHGYHLFFKAKNQVYINLWHGMPLKAMGYTENKPKILPPNSDDENYYLIATSTIMKNALATCFNQNPRRIYITGQPRNDKLFKDCARNLIQGSEYETIILYTPTYHENKFNNFPFPDFEREMFQDFLRIHKILFLVKFHPLEERVAMKFFKDMENLIFINDQILREQGIDLYNILPCADVLVTDYSSVYFDFLLLDRPIVFAVPDLDEYRERRGFVLEPFDFWTPGPKVKNFEEFLKELERCIKNPDYYREERKTINNLVNYYKDDKSSQRIYKLIWGRI